VSGSGLMAWVRKDTAHVCRTVPGTLNQVVQVGITATPEGFPTTTRPRTCTPVPARQSPD